MVRVAKSHPTRHGYLLTGYPEDCAPHRGKWQGTMIYVVGRNTDQQRLFRRDALADASAYARQHFATIEAIATGDLCDQAVVDVYGQSP